MTRGVVNFRHAAVPVVRVRGLDVARGLAMAFVCLSHFGLAYFSRLNEPSIAKALTTVGLIGSPAFMLISGMTLGLLYETRRQRFSHLRLLLADRALFMLTVGHILILLANVPRLSSLEEALQRGFITDVIAVAVLLGPALVMVTSPRARVVLAFSLYATAWVLSIRWTPASPLGDTVRYILAGPYPEDVRYNFPLLHWIAVYFASSILGQWLGRQLRMDRQREAERSLIAWGSAAVMVVVLYKLGQWTLAFPSSLVYAAMASPWTKLPPSPAYLLFYGGMALLLVAGALFVDRRRLIEPLFGWATTLGRASLFVFILQFYVYDVVLWSIRLPYTNLWPLVFVGSLVVIITLAKLWDSRAANRYLTVGVPQLLNTRMGQMVVSMGTALSQLRFRVGSERLKESENA